MFESDEKKTLKNKYNKLSSISGANKLLPGGIDLKAMGSNSVYGELKLSEKLSDELQFSRQQVAELREILEETCNTRDGYRRDLDETLAELAESQKALQS
jgi:hypothetical protein